MDEKEENKRIDIIEYITHHDFNGLALNGKKLALSAGTKVYNILNVLVTADGEYICLATSENGKRHFARNDDGKGLERGNLTHTIAFEDFPFTADGIDMLSNEYADWLQPRDDVILFNDNFFAAELDELMTLYNKLIN